MCFNSCSPMTTPSMYAQQMGSLDQRLGSSPAVVVVTIVSVLSVLFIFYEATWLSTQHVPTRSTRAHSDANRELERVGSVISNQRTIKPGSTFFIDSSADLQSPFTFDVPSACAVESTAIHNPTRQIQFLVFGNRSLNLTHPLTKMVINLPKVEVMVVSIENFTLGTPYEGSFVTKAVSDNFYNHKTSKEVRLKLRRYLGDALRALLLWKYGGIYLDQDIITLKGFEGFKNAAGCRVLLERGNLVPPVAVNCLRVNFGVIALDQGHQLAGDLVKNFAAKEVSEDKPPNGNTDLNRLLYSLCGQFKLFQALIPLADSALVEKKKMQFVDSHVSPGFVYSLSCLASLNFSILDTKFFYPLPPSEVGYYFDPKFTQRVISWINSSGSYLVHYFETQAYKYFNSTWDIPRESAYGVLAKENCPKTFDIGFPNMPA